MVVGISTGNGFKGTISYVQKEHEKDLAEDKKPQIIEKNNIYGNTQSMAKQMRFVSNGNSRISKPVMHVSVNFSKAEKLSEDQRQKAVQSVLKEMGVKSENHQYLIAKHNDTENPHYHIVLNKVDLDGKKLNLGFDGKREEFIKNRLQVIADKIEQQQGLKRTEGRNIIYDPTNEKGYRFLTAEEKAQRKPREKKINLNKNPNTRNQQLAIKEIVQKVLEDKKTISPGTFRNNLAIRGVNVKFSENKNGIYGISFKTDKISVKGSEVGAKWSDINKVLTENSKAVQETQSLKRSEVESHLKGSLNNVVKLSLSNGYSANVNGLLKKAGFEKNQNGYDFQFKGTNLFIKSDLENGIFKLISDRESLKTAYEKNKAYQEKVINAKPLQIKPVPFLFNSKIKEENAKAEIYNKRLSQEKENVKINPIREPNEERQILITD